MIKTGTLYFKHFYGFIEAIKTDIAREDCYDEIEQFVKKINPEYKIYYLRTWEDNNGVVHFDVGSHSEFFYWSEKDLEVSG